MNCTFPPPPYSSEPSSSSSTNIDHHQCWWNNKNALIPFSQHPQQQQPFNYPSLPSTSISAPIEWYPPTTKKISPPSFEMNFQGIESMQQQRLALEPFYYPPTTTNFFSSLQESFPSDPIPTTNSGFAGKTQINSPTTNVEKNFEESKLSVLNEKELSKAAAAIKRRRRLRRQGREGDKRLPRRRFQACWGNSNYSIETTTTTTTTTTTVGFGIFFIKDENSFC